MKLLKLEILSLASLDNQDGEVINFEEGALGESTIFSIVGPMGSGKSTLLDAICLALYNRAPRYPRKKGDKNQNIEVFGMPDEGERNRLAPTDSRNILTRGRRAGYSKLTFLANDGQVYRAEWHVRFQRVRYDSPDTRLYRLTKSVGRQQEEAADWNELPQIIGLDYDQFLRTVLIAQGSFANFLNAKENERYELLEKLIGCEETYTAIAYKIKARKDAAVEAYNTIQAEVEAVRQHMLTDEQLALLEEETQQLEKQEEELAEEQKRLEAAAGWYVEEEKLQKAIADQQAREKQARQARAAGNEAAERLRLHDALLPAVNMLSEVRRLEQGIGNMLQALEADRKNIDAQAGRIETEKQVLKQLTAAAEQAVKTLNEAIPHINKARELKTQLKAAADLEKERQETVNNAEKEKKRAEDTVSRNVEDVRTATENYRKAAESLTMLQEAIAEKKRMLDEQVGLAERALKTEQQKAEGQSADELQQRKTDADKAVADMRRAAETAKGKEDTLAEQETKLCRAKALADENAAIGRELDALTMETLAQEVQTLRKAHTLMTSENWRQHRHNLSTGIPCPLCGSTDHPYQEDSRLFDEAASELSVLMGEKEEMLRRQTQRREELHGKKKANEGELKGLKERLTQLEAILRQLEQERASLLTAYPQFPEDRQSMEVLMSEFTDRQRLASEALTTYNKVQKNITRLSKEKDRAVQMLAAYEKESAVQAETARKREGDARMELERQQTLTPTLTQQQVEKQQVLTLAMENLQTARQALQNLQTAFRAELEGADPDEMEQRLKKKADEADRAVRAKTDAVSGLTARLGEMMGAQQARQTQLKAGREELAVKGGELDAWVSSYNQQDGRIRDVAAADIDALLTATDNWEAIRQDIEAKDKALTAARTLLDNSRQQHAQHQQTKPARTREELTFAQQDLQARSHQQELIAAKARRTAHDQARALLGSKAELVDRATQEKDDWTDITEAIGTEGKTLRKIAQCYTLRFLIAHANAEIRKFNSRYELIQVRNSLGLRVVDHDRADDIRDTTSLSGGETFIVSLGLALGLSSLSSRNISFQNLFIDEGFGTLDPDTLSTVIDSLAMLQSSQGKKVGVISHTDTMSERITTQIRIVKNGNSGSSHIEIYPLEQHTSTD